ncbi:MAG TPA: CHAT domain-containing protein [Allocoleopsis sp.]
MSPQPSRSKTCLTQRLSLSLLTTAVLALLPGMRGAEAIAISPNQLLHPIGLPQPIAQSSDARKAEADRLLQQGLQQYQTSQFTVALQSSEKALQIYREIKNRPGEGAALVIMGGTYASLGDYAKAIDYLQQGLAIVQAVKSRQFEEIALGSLGSAWLQQGLQQYKNSQFPAALQSSEKALQIFRELENRPAEGAALVIVGGTYASLSDYAKAIDYLQQGLTIVQEVKNRQFEEIALSTLGTAWLQQGVQQYQTSQFTAAVQSSEKALQIFQETKNRSGEGAALIEIGSTYVFLGNYAQAIHYLQQGLGIAQEVKNRQLEELALNNLGNVYSSLGDYAKALEQYNRSLAIAREIKDRSGEEKVLGDLGVIYFSLRDYAKAMEYQNQSLAIAREIKDRLAERATLLNLGNVYFSLSDYAKAIDYYKQCLTLSQELKDRLGEETALGNLGYIYNAQGNFAQGIEYNQQSLAIAREIKDRLGEGKALSRLGLALAKSGKVTEAEPILRASIQVLESLRQNLSNTDKVSIADTQNDPYKFLQVVLLAQNKGEAALEIAERGRARAFLEQLAKRVQATEQPTIAPIQIAAFRQVTQDQNATLVEYSQIYDWQLFIWVVKPNGEIAVRNVDLTPLKQQNTSLDQLVASTRCLGSSQCEASVATNRGSRGLEVVPSPTQSDRIGNTPPNQPTQNLYLQQLHKLLIAPIADLLPADPNAHVIFLPQGSLFLAPFAALQDSQGKYLIEQHTIVIAPSIQVLELTHQQRQQVQRAGRQQVLVVGNPKMPLKLPQLPGAEQEAKAIAALLHTQPILGTQATKAAIVQQMPNARWIHLATHGILDDRQGLESAIALAPNGTGEKPDGLLTADEILNLKLNAELVVLSACDSGGGRITGDGVIGLSRSLITAGVPSILVSLWAVPDAPTASLMQGFYQQLQSNPDKAQALRQTMLSTMKQHPDPRDWAAFMLIGEAQ